MPYRCFCAFLFVASIALIGTAIGYQILHLPNSTLLLKLGLMSFLMGVYMYLDTKDISLLNFQFEILVSDDGVGFVAGTEGKGEGTHVGIRNCI